MRFCRPSSYPRCKSEKVLRKVWRTGHGAKMHGCQAVQRACTNLGWRCRFKFICQEEWMQKAQAVYRTFGTHFHWWPAWVQTWVRQFFHELWQRWERTCMSQSKGAGKDSRYATSATRSENDTQNVTSKAATNVARQSWTRERTQNKRPVQPPREWVLSSANSSAQTHNLCKLRIALDAIFSVLPNQSLGH